MSVINSTSTDYVNTTLKVIGGSTTQTTVLLSKIINVVSIRYSSHS